MNIRIISTTEDFARYDQWVTKHPQGSLWQSLERKAYIEALGKEVQIYICEDQTHICASALVVIDRTSFGLSTWEIPRGPLWNAELRMKNEECILLQKIIEDARQDSCIALYLSPYTPILHSEFCILNSERYVHCEATRIIDLTQSEDDILKQMKQKGRYNIKVAQKKGVIVEESDDIDAYYALASETGHRDGFQIPSKKHLTTFLHELKGSFLLLAYPESQVPQPVLSLPKSPKSQYSSTPISQSPSKPIAGLLGVMWNKRAIYYYGASSYAHRASMAPYALQWEAMQKCKQAGCTEYDLLGIAPEGEGQGAGNGEHPWAGISKFKERFGGEIAEYPPEQEIVFKPMAQWLLSMKRRWMG